MKRIFLSVISINYFLCIYAQTSTLYNFNGDQAFQKEDYQTARIYFSEGLESCDRYSIQRLVDIWKIQPSMRESMRRPMLSCFNCMKTIVENREPDMMLLFSDFYKYGIGTPVDSIQSKYWYDEYAMRTILDLDIPPEKVFLTGDSSAIKIPKKSLLSNHFYSFITYTYSPTMPYGFTTGIYFDKIGFYVSGRTSSKSVNATYECNNEKVPAIEILNPLYEFNRERWHCRMITGGILYPIIKNKFFVSAGGGYGKRDYYREIITKEQFSTGNKSEWCYNTEASYKGLTLEAGGMFVWKKLTVAGGINSTKFKDFDVYIGLGLSF